VVEYVFKKYHRIDYVQNVISGTLPRTTAASCSGR
jgi:hypothetical protein